MAKKEVEFKITAKDRSKAAFLSAKRSLGGLKSAASAAKIPVLAGAAVVGGLAALAVQSIKTADAVAKAADAIGIHTDTLQEYQFAADLAGVSSEQLDSGFKKFTKTFGELRANTGSAVTYLKLFDKQLLENLQSTESTDDALTKVLTRSAM